MQVPDAWPVESPAFADCEEFPRIPPRAAI
jgi:hypothetical protein